MKDPQGRSKGFAYVDYSSEELAQESLKSNQMRVDGHCLYVALSRPPQGQNDRTLVLSNLPYDLDN